jgi:cytochrome c2
MHRLNATLDEPRRAATGLPVLAWTLLLLAVLAIVRLALPERGARREPVWQIAGADARRGRALVGEAGCAACHTVPGVRNARGNVGPPLARFADRTYIAGMLPNEPRSLVHWLRHPQQVVPGNAMPEMGLDERDARDIAAYLYTLR